jgi:peptidase A4-like protein
MSFHIRWARALLVASGFTLLLAGAMPVSASAHAVKKLHGSHHNLDTAIRATVKAGKSSGQTLIFGGGDEAGASIGIAPTESLTNLESMLSSAGYGVDVSATLPKNLSAYKSVWFVNTDSLNASAEHELEDYVESGHGLYLTGESSDCCSALDETDSSIVNAVLTSGGVTVGSPGDADVPNAANSINASAIDNVATFPNDLTGWTPDGPGGLAGVTPTNVLTSTDFGGQSTPTGAVWDGSSVNGGRGRLAILMNINWLESEFWDQATAAEMVVNLERFLTFSSPVAVGYNSAFSGYAATANGVRDVTGAWTIPTVTCSQVPKASAVGIWVGIDGFKNSALIKAGVGVTCSSPSADPCYYLFTEVKPATEEPITACSGVAPGDDISVDITNSPYGSSAFDATITVNGSIFGGQPIILTASKYKDKSAECVVELPPGHVGPTSGRYHQLADFGSVSFTQCQATATENAGNALDVDQLATGSDDSFIVTSLDLGNRTKVLAKTVPPTFPDLTWSVAWNGAPI